MIFASTPCRGNVRRADVLDRARFLAARSAAATHTLYLRAGRTRLRRAQVFRQRVSRPRLRDRARGQQWGLPNGYILGEEGSGAFVAGLRYGEGTLYKQKCRRFARLLQGPSVGFDWGGDGARTMTLVYNLPATNAIYQRFAGHQWLCLYQSAASG